MRNLLFLVITVIMLNGCTGAVSGHKYTIEDVKKAEKAYLKAKEVYITSKKYVDTKSQKTDLK